MPSKASRTMLRLPAGTPSSPAMRTASTSVVDCVLQGPPSYSLNLASALVRTFRLLLSALIGSLSAMPRLWGRQGLRRRNFIARPRRPKLQRCALGVLPVKSAGVWIFRLDERPAPLEGPLLAPVRVYAEHMRCRLAPLQMQEGQCGRPQAPQPVLPRRTEGARIWTADVQLAPANASGRPAVAAVAPRRPPCMESLARAEQRRNVPQRAPHRTSSPEQGPARPFAPRQWKSPSAKLTVIASLARRPKNTLMASSAVSSHLTAEEQKR